MTIYDDIPNPFVCIEANSMDLLKSAEIEFD